MYSFRYHRAKDLDDALRAFQESTDPKFLAGGQTLLPSLRLRLAQPECLIDLSEVKDINGIRSVSDSTLSIGAMTCHADVTDSPLVRQMVPALAELAGHIGDPLVRNRGTLGGSIANSDPAADYPAGVLGLNAVVVTTARRIAADDFFLGMFETALRPDELILAVEFSAPRRAAYVKFKHPASRFALVGVFVAETDSGVRVAVTGAASCAFRVQEMEDALTIRFSPDALNDIALDASEMNGDMYASPSYRAHLVKVIAQRAVQAALTR